MYLITLITIPYSSFLLLNVLFTARSFYARSVQQMVEH